MPVGTVVHGRLIKSTLDLREVGVRKIKGYVRFLHEEKVAYGELQGNEIYELTSSCFDSPHKTGTIYDISQVQLLNPCQPSKVVCVGLNYPTGEDVKISPDPLLFMKPTSSIIGPDENIVQWPEVKELTFEAELAVVIGQRIQRVSIEEAENFILGYTLANDVTARDLQRVDSQWTRSKSFDTFLPLGPIIRTDMSWENIRIRSWINGELYQDGNTQQMFLNIPYLISYISQIMTLEPGDIILTGTPGGYGGLMKAGDRVDIEIDGIGRLTNSVIPFLE